MPDLRDHSIEIIRRHQAPSGAYVACPTFAPYRFCWLRDGTFTAYAMDRAGHHDSARRFYLWVDSVLRREAGRVDRIADLLACGQAPDHRDMPPTRYRIDGVPEEDKWPNFQLDGYGTWLWGLAEHVAMTGDTTLLEQARKSVDLTIRYLSLCWKMPNYDCWEEFGDRLHPATLACLYGGLAAAGRLLACGGAAAQVVGVSEVPKTPRTACTAHTGPAIRAVESSRRADVAEAVEAAEAIHATQATCATRAVDVAWAAHADHAAHAAPSAYAAHAAHAAHAARALGAPGASNDPNASGIAGLAESIREYILDHGVAQGRFVKSLGNPSIDASLLWLAMPFAVVEPSDPLMLSTVEEIERRLYHSGVHRYPEDTYYGGGEWPLLACWLGWYYCRAGRPASAAPIVDWVERCANERGELPEQVSDHVNDPTYLPVWQERWGPVATPLLWSHAMYLVLLDELAKAQVKATNASVQRVTGQTTRGRCEVRRFRPASGG